MRLVIALLALAAPALVQPVRAAQDFEYSTAETRKLMHAYAQCAVARQARRASEALVRNVDNSVILRTYPQLIAGDCLAKQTRRSTKMSFSGDLYRYALADALVSHEFSTSEALRFESVPRLDHRDPGELPKPIGANGKRLSARKYEAAVKDHKQGAAIAYISRYGECVVRSAPGEARALLKTAPDSAEESVRFGALRVALGTCLREGESLRFGRTTLRGTIAVNYYRLAYAARAGAAGTAL
ncbi:MAG TPA: hypothetical protein VF631_03760 [Allosphingosinicella sp.]|jgi:hypothetical protein|uniref:hypothetical protein n=1 Tax=Allosphingosinicella sp. TaxID=2823234 RepID=UPI002F2800C3